MVGRVAGQLVTVLFTLLKRDQDVVAQAKGSPLLPEPVVYDPALHQRHRAGHYTAPGARPRGTVVRLPLP